MTTLHKVNFEDYWRTPVKPRGFSEFCDMVVDSSHDGKIKGIWEITRTDSYHRVLERIWNMNVITDAGANALLQRGCNSLSATLPNIFNQIAMTNGSGSTTLTAALINGNNYTSLSVAALPAAIPATTGGAATQVTIGFGTGQTQVVTLSAGASSGATSIAVNGFTANATYAIGAAVVPLPNVAENPSALTGSIISYSGALVTGAFTYTPTSGAGNRTLVVTYQFSVAGGASVGTYTDFWLVNTNPVGATGQTLAHEINSPMRCDSTPNNVTATVTIKI